MQIFIMRHGQASSMAAADAERPLTQHGVDEVTLMANWLKSLLLTFDKIFVSPFKRAQQTANTVTALLNDNSGVISNFITTLDFITPSGSAHECRDYIDRVLHDKEMKNGEKEQRVLIISHMPLVSYLVAELTHQQNCPIFQTAAIAEINYDEETMTGQLQQLISPNDLH